MLRAIKLEPPSPGTPDNPMLIPSDDGGTRAVEQERQRQQRSSTPSSTTNPDLGAQCPHSWLQLLRPPVEPCAGQSREPCAMASEVSEVHQGVSSLSTPDSDDEPLIERRLRGKRPMNERDEEPYHSPAVVPKRQCVGGNTLHNIESTPAPSLTRGSMPAAHSPVLVSTVVHNGFRVVVAPPLQSRVPEIRCRGEMTFKQAKGFGGNGGNYIFQWPLGVGNPFFIIVCEQCKHSAKGRGYFWKHPFEGSASAGLKHFGMHMNVWQILEHSGWHVTDAREHFEEMLNHNSTLAEKQPPKMKLKAIHSAA